mmetsp:Transcript_41549/g.46306  ORF Transcript_41549/g.46306 Transcript_41549/m.46306 type:complete len:246 (-) Transcript_41549:15-752(-)
MVSHSFMGSIRAGPASNMPIPLIRSYLSSSRLHRSRSFKNSFICARCDVHHNGKCGLKPSLVLSNLHVPCLSLYCSISWKLHSQTAIRLLSQTVKSLSLLFSFFFSSLVSSSPLVSSLFWMLVAAIAAVGNASCPSSSSSSSVSVCFGDVPFPPLLASSLLLLVSLVIVVVVVVVSFSSNSFNLASNSCCIVAGKPTTARGALAVNPKSLSRFARSAVNPEVTVGSSYLRNDVRCVQHHSINFFS